MDTLSSRILELTINIQQIPAPTFSEEKRAAFLKARFSAKGLSNVTMDEMGNVYAQLPGNGLSPPLIVSAHSDTVFPAETDLSLVKHDDKITGPGIGDNSLGVAGLFALIWSLEESGVTLPGDLWFIANVAEEGLGNLLGMQAVVERFGSTPLAYIVIEGMALGQVYHRGLAVQRYRITCHTAGGHSWVDFGRPSAIHELAALVTQITDLPLPDDPRTTINVGVISGGSTVNTIASEAHLELDLRSEDRASLVTLSQHVESLINNACRSDVQFNTKITSTRPVGSIPLDHPLVELAVHSLQSQGVHSYPNIGSTDANVPLSKGFPAICIGLTSGSGAHTIHETIHIQPLSKGLKQLVSVVTGAFEVLK